MKAKNENEFIYKQAINNNKNNFIYKKQYAYLYIDIYT
jgi:hypothetical protein